MLLHDPACTMSVSSPLRNKEVKVWKETNGEEVSMTSKWEEMVVRISILGWDSISIIDIDLRSLLCCLFQEALLSVFSQGGWNWRLTHLVSLKAHTNNMVWHHKVSQILGNSENDDKSFLWLLFCQRSPQKLSQQSKLAVLCQPRCLTVKMLPISLTYRDSSSHCCSITFLLSLHVKLKSCRAGRQTWLDWISGRIWKDCRGHVAV